MGNVYSQIANREGVVIPSGSIGDNEVVRGDGGANGIQGSSFTLTDAGALSGPGDLTITRAEIAGDVIVEVENTDNTSTSSHSVLLSTVGGTSGGDPKASFVVTGGETWSIGAKNDVSDYFYISRNANLATANAFFITSSAVPEIWNNGNIVCSGSINGSPRFIGLRNTSNTPGSNAQLELQVGGASGGDPKITFIVQGVGVKWHAGLDNDDSDIFKIGRGASIGTNTEFSITEGSVAKLHNGVVHNHRTVSVSDNIEITDYFVGVDDNSSPRTLTLPSTAVQGQTFTVKDEAGTAASANPITIDTAGAETIDGAATATINSDYGALRFYFDGSNYFIY